MNHTAEGSLGIVELEMALQCVLIFLIILVQLAQRLGNGIAECQSLQTLIGITQLRGKIPGIVNAAQILFW